MAAALIANDVGTRIVVREARLMPLQQGRPASGIGLNDPDGTQEFLLGWNCREHGGRNVSIRPVPPILPLQR